MHKCVYDGHPGSVLRSTAARRFNTTRCFYLRPKYSAPRTLLGIRTDRATVLAITKKFVCLALIMNKWEAIEVRTAGGGILVEWVKWPVEWVANWPIMPPSASMRGQNRSPTPPLGGGGPSSIVFRATGRLYLAIVSHHAINTALL